MQCGRIITVMGVMWIFQSESAQIILNFDDCNYLYHVREITEYRLQWKGNYRGIGCQVTFFGYDDTDSLDEYRVCIRALTWHFYDPSVVLKYYSSKNPTHSISDLKRTYTRSSSPSPETEWCSEQKDYVSVKLENTGTTTGNITLKIYGIKSVDHESLKDSQIVGIIVGTVLGALVVIGIIITLVIVIFYKRRRERSRNGTTNTNIGQVITRRISTQQCRAGSIPYNISTTSLPLYEEVMTHKEKYKYRGKDSTETTSDMMLNTISLYVVIVSLECVTAWPQSLGFDDCYNTYNVNNDKSYELTWNGDTYLSGCKVKFHGYDPSAVLDEYKVCVKASTWSIVDAGVTLNYYTGIFSSFLEKTFSKSSGSPTYEWCADGYDYVSVELMTSQTSLYQGTITLQVTAIKIYSYQHNYIAAIGGVFAAVFVIAVIVGIIAVIVRKCRTSRTTILTVPATTGNTIITHYGTQQQTSYTTGTTNPPAYQQPTNAFVTGYQNPFPGNHATAPPQY